MSNVKYPILHYEKERDYMCTFLNSIKSRNNKFKKQIISPLRYAGGKSSAVGLILDNIPLLKTKKIVSPFFGGGSVELVLSSILGFEIIGYDIFDMLVNFWNQIINNKENFINELSKLNISKNDFNKYRFILLNYWNKIKPENLIYKYKKTIELNENEEVLLDNNKLLQSVYYYYNMTNSYGPMFVGWQSSVELKQNKFNNKIQKIKNMNFGNIKILCKDFKDIFDFHKNDFLYLDPPYYLNGDSKLFKGMYPNCNFAIHHNNFDHELLFKLLQNHIGGFLLTYNNCEYIKDLYKDYEQVFPSWNYSYGNGETRIGKNRLNGNNTNIKESHEIFIICPPIV
jgi:DNA adenine methylase